MHKVSLIVSTAVVADLTMTDQIHQNDQDDEAMEWITDWDYERVMSPEHHVLESGKSALYHAAGADDDASMIMEEDDDEDGDHSPLPLDHPIDPRDESSHEIAIFWTRATEELTEDDLTGMFDVANTPILNPCRNSNSRTSLGLLMMEEQPARSKEVYDDDEDNENDSIMSPLQDKEGLLPPMSPSQLYQGNAHYGMIESHNHKARLSFPNDSMATHTTVDLMDDESEDEYDHHNDVHGTDDSIYQRQQQLLQQVLQQAPASAAAIRKRTQLPQPSDHQQRLLQEMRAKRKKPEDPIFQRQQEIFLHLRSAERPKQQPDRHIYNQYSPVSVTRTLTRAGMDTEEYQRVVTRLTEKNLIERQRIMLQESMKRSLETRQALHIKPTALPDYNHDKLSKVLKNIESSSRNISETYGRR